MRQLLYRALKWVLVIIPYIDAEGRQQHYFNLLNPLGWLVIVIVGLFMGLQQWWNFTRFMVADAIKGEREASRLKSASKTAKSA